MVIRGAVYRVDLGDATRGRVPPGRRLGVVLSPSSMPWSVATIVPASTSAQPAVFRPALKIAGRATLFLVDEIRTIDVGSIHGDPVYHLNRDEMAEIEHAVARYLSL